MLPWRLIADSVLDNGLREEHAKSWRGAEESITWLCLSLSRSSQSYNKTHNRHRRLTPLGFTHLIPVGSHMVITHVHKLEIANSVLWTPACTNYIHPCVCYIPLLVHETEFLCWTQGQSPFSQHKITSVRKSSLGADSLKSVHYFNYKPKIGCRRLYWNSSKGFLQYCIIPHSESWERELLGSQVWMYFPLWGLHVYTVPKYSYI